jgi:hypothetical protein
MGLRSNLDEMSKDALEFLRRSMNGCKLRLVENLSLLMGGLVCGFVLFQLLFVAYLALIVAIVILLLPHIGLPLSIVVAALLMLLTAMIVYMLRERLFVDGIVRHLSRIFFEKSTDDDKKG